MGREGRQQATGNTEQDGLNGQKPMARSGMQVILPLNAELRISSVTMTFRRMAVLALLIATYAGAADLTRQVLVGRWDYTSFTMIEHGNPVETIQFKPSSMVFTYRSDGTWDLEANDATQTRLHGSYELRGKELIMKKADGSPYQDFRVEVNQDGRQMLLRDAKSLITATKISAGD